MPVFQVGDLVQLRYDGDLGMIIRFPMHTFYPSAEILWAGDPIPQRHDLADLLPHHAPAPMQPDGEPGITG